MTPSQVQEARKRTFDRAYKLADEVNCRLYLSSHFIERFNIRAAEQMKALGAFEVAMRSIIRRLDQGRGHKAAAMISSHVFIFDLMQEGQIRLVTFWVTHKPPEEALAGRGAVLIAHQ
jgi:hypothetical protein